MYSEQEEHKKRIFREKAVQLYLSAFEQGDFEAMDPILALAEQDTILETMIHEAHDYLLKEEEFVLKAEEREKISQLAIDCILSGIQDEEEEINLPPLTVADVLEKMKSNIDLSKHVRREANILYEQIPTYPLPENLNYQSISQLFQTLGRSASLAMQKGFRDQAIFLSMAREQGKAQLMAARRQRQFRRQRKEHREE